MVTTAGGVHAGPLTEFVVMAMLIHVKNYPHSASTAGSENRKITDIFCHNLRCYLDGRAAEMRNVLDKVKMY